MTPTKIQIKILSKALLYGGARMYNVALAEVALLKYPDLNDVEAIAVALFYRRTFVSKEYDAPHFVKAIKPETIANWKARIAAFREMTPDATMTPEIKELLGTTDRDRMYSAWLNIVNANKMYDLALLNLRRCSTEVYRTFPRD